MLLRDLPREMGHEHLSSSEIASLECTKTPLSLPIAPEISVEDDVAARIISSYRNRSKISLCNHPPHMNDIFTLNRKVLVGEKYEGILYDLRLDRLGLNNGINIWTLLEVCIFAMGLFDDWIWRCGRPRRRFPLKIWHRRVGIRTWCCGEIAFLEIRTAIVSSWIGDGLEGLRNVRQLIAEDVVPWTCIHRQNVTMGNRVEIKNNIHSVHLASGRILASSLLQDPVALPSPWIPYGPSQPQPHIWCWLCGLQLHVWLAKLSWSHWKYLEWQRVSLHFDLPWTDDKAFWDLLWAALPLLSEVVLEFPELDCKERAGRARFCSRRFSWRTLGQRWMIGEELRNTKFDESSARCTSQSSSNISGIIASPQFCICDGADMTVWNYTYLDCCLDGAALLILSSYLRREIKSVLMPDFRSPRRPNSDCRSWTNQAL